jgi:xanthine/uracil permease
MNIMKQQIHIYWDILRSDRTLLVQSVLIAVVGGVYLLYLGLSLAPTDLQIATRYTSFGGTQYYRNKWYYLLSFAVLGIVVVVSHLGLMVKLTARGMRPLGVAFGWLSIVLFGLLFFFTFSVLGVAYLS